MVRLKQHIRKFKNIYNEFLKSKDNFDIEDALFNIIKIHNNKKHSTSKRTPKDIRDLTDENEINIIKQEIIKSLERKNKNKDKIEFDKFYVIDGNNCLISNNTIIKNKGKKKRKNKNLISIFKEGKIYEINIELLEEVEENLWNNLL